MERPREPKMAVAVGFALLILIVIAILSHQATNRVIRYADELSSAEKALLELKPAQLALTHAHDAVRNYVISGKETNLDPYWSDMEEIDQHFGRLDAATNSDLKREMAGLKTAVNNDLLGLDEAISSRRRGQPGSDVEVRTGGENSASEQIARVIGQMETKQEQLLSERRPLTASRVASLLLVAQPVVAITFLSLMYLVAARLLSRRGRNDSIIRKRHEWSGMRLSIEALGTRRQALLRKPYTAEQLLKALAEVLGEQKEEKAPEPIHGLLSKHSPKPATIRPH